jgi:hypothetical protein
LNDVIGLIIGLVVGVVITAIVHSTGYDSDKGFYKTRRKRKK